MRSKKILVFGLLMSLVAMFLVIPTAGCGGGQTSGAKKVYIGLTAVLSGPAADYGEDVKAGLEKCIDEINSAGGVNIGGQDYIFILKSADDQAAPDQALANAQKFVLEDGINIIYSPLASNTTGLMGINHKPGEEFLIESYSSVPLYKSSPNDLMITFPPPFTTYIGPFVQQATSRGWKKAACMETTGAYGDMWNSAFKQAWAAAGGSITTESRGDYYSVSDFTPHITKVLATNPDVILCGGPSGPTAMLIQQTRNLGYTGGFICIDQAKLDAMADIIGMGPLENTIGVQVTEQADSLYGRDFAIKYHEETGKRLSWETAINYTAFHLMVESMKIAGSVDDIQAIRAAYAKNSVASPDEWPVEFAGMDNATGQLYMPAQAAITQNGKFVSLPLIRWWEKG